MTCSHEVVGVASIDLVDDAESLRLLEVDQAAGDHQLDRLRLADAGAASRCVPPVPGQHAEGHLGQADLAGALARDAQVGRHRDLEAAADACGR